MSTIGTVESLWRYPVKSMRGEELGELFASYAGVYGDRLFAFESSTPKAFHCSNGNHLLPPQCSVESLWLDRVSPYQFIERDRCWHWHRLLIVRLLHRAIDRFLPLWCSRHSQREQVRLAPGPIARPPSGRRSRHVIGKFRVPPNSSPPLSMGRRL